MLRGRSPESRAGVIGLACLLTAGLVPAQEDAGKACPENDRQAYLETLGAAIVARWRVPGHYRNIDCTVRIAQSFRGEVLNATVEDCTDPELVKLIVDATYRASPLPSPANAACHQREIDVRLQRAAD